MPGIQLFGGDAHEEFDVVEHHESKTLLGVVVVTRFRTTMDRKS